MRLSNRTHFFFSSPFHPPPRSTPIRSFSANIVNEITKSEEMYVMVLEQFVGLFCRPLLATPSEYGATKQQAKDLCEGIMAIAAYARKFVALPTFRSNIGQTFLDQADQLSKVGREPSRA